MASSPSTCELRPGRGILNPFNASGYLAWLAVAAQMVTTRAGLPLSSTEAILAAVGLIGTLLLYTVRTQLPETVSPRLERGLTLGQLLLALLTCWAFPGTLVPALLVMTVPGLAYLFKPRSLVAILLAANIALVLVSSHHFHTQTAQLVFMLAYIALQALCVLCVVYAVQANDARRDVLSINAELLATRHLLDDSVRAEERLRLSRELHDIAGHKLTALKLKLALQARRGGENQQDFIDCERLADELLRDIRGVVSTLRQGEGVDLHSALRALDPGLPRPQLRFELDPAVRVTDLRAALSLLRCAQEGLTNALRHSDASRLRIVLAQDAGSYRLSVEDDGVGRVEQLQAGNGLRGLRERLEAEGARLELENRQPRGLVLRAVLPIGESPC